MITFLVLVLIVLGICCVFLFTKPDFPLIELIVKRISFYSLIGVLICIVLLIFDLRFKGNYTTSIIGLTFILSTILLFGLTRNTWTKILCGFLTIPLFVIAFLSLIWEMSIFIIYIIVLPFEPPTAKFVINKNHNIEVRVGGFLACGESLIITESKLGVFDKQKYVGNISCVTGISKIETLEFNTNCAEFVIYHDGQTEFDNPYKYRVKF